MCWESGLLQRPKWTLAASAKACIGSAGALDCSKGSTGSWWKWNIGIQYHPIQHVAIMQALRLWPEFHMWYSKAEITLTKSMTNRSANCEELRRKPVARAFPSRNQFHRQVPLRMQWMRSRPSAIPSAHIQLFDRQAMSCGNVELQNLGQTGSLWLLENSNCITLWQQHRSNISIQL